jgi:hypothetical protein
MLNEVTERSAPIFVGPSTPLDWEIDRVLSDGKAREPREIHAELDGTYPLGQVHARLKVMVARRLIQRIAQDGAPRRGRGAGTYRRA